MTKPPHPAGHDPDAAQVVVIGKTAGSVAAPHYGGLVTDPVAGKQPADVRCTEGGP